MQKNSTVYNKFKDDNKYHKRWYRSISPKCHSAAKNYLSSFVDFVRTASTVTHGKKVQLTRIRSLLRAFQWA